ncbi:MAG: hypothetical protein WCA21_06545 [Terracidiphilus sp.]
MNPSGTNSAYSSSAPALVHQILCLHLIATLADAAQQMKMIEMTRPPDSQAETMPEWRQRILKYDDELGRLLLQIERIENFMGRKQKCRNADPAESFDWTFMARLVRGMIQRGASDEYLAAYLKRSMGGGSTGRKHGRPSGAMNYDGLALQALEIHNMNPKFWTWPRLADRVFADCKAHSKHTSDDSCTVKLRQAVTRLRAFIRELESVRTYREIQSAICDIKSAQLLSLRD